ncbi:unnamed protein product [Victoria cruziana]
MDWHYVLDKQNSGARIRNWGQSGRRSERCDRKSIRLGSRNDVYCDCMHFPSGLSSSLSSSFRKMLWGVLWRRIKKERCRIFDHSNHVSGAYDPHSYAQNFDHGSASFEPDNLGRSFSARPTSTALWTENHPSLLHRPTYRQLFAGGKHALHTRATWVPWHNMDYAYAMMLMSYPPSFNATHDTSHVIP